jgi:acetyl esterase/lipase
MAKTPAEMVTPPVVYRLPGMEDARVFSDLKYSDADDPNLLMDVYVPADSAAGKRHPVIVLIHGGGASQYRPKDWGIFRSWGRLIAAHGMVGVTFTHRLGYPEPFLEKAGADLASALAYIRANAESWNADSERVGLVAFSAGGPMLTLAMQEKLEAVRCLVGFYAYLPIQEPAVFSSMKPMFIARAGKDAAPGLNDAMDRFIAAALAANAPVTAINHPAGEHGFDNQTDDERSREIIAAALAFLRTHLG